MMMTQLTTTRALQSAATLFTGEKSRQRDTKAFKGKGGLATLYKTYNQEQQAIQAEMQNLALRTREVKAPCYLVVIEDTEHAPRLRWRMVGQARYYTFANCDAMLVHLAPMVADFFTESAQRAEELNLMAKINRNAILTLEKHLRQKRETLTA